MKNKIKKLLFKNDMTTKDISEEKLSEYKKQYIESGENLNKNLNKLIYVGYGVIWILSKDILIILENKNTLWFAILLFTAAIVLEIVESYDVRNEIKNKKRIFR